MNAEMRPVTSNKSLENRSKISRCFLVQTRMLRRRGDGCQSAAPFKPGGTTGPSGQIQFVMARIRATSRAMGKTTRWKPFIN